MYWLIIIIAAILTLAGIVAYVAQSRSGLTATGLNDRFTWGLYIQGFFFFSALAAGMLVFIAVVTLFEETGLRPLAMNVSAVSLGCMAAAGIMLGADLGKPLRVFRIILSNNWSSPMTWDFYMLALCVALNLIYLAGVVGAGPGGVVWSVLCLGAALAFIMVHTLFFLSREGAGFRSQPFLALDTLIHSLWGGLAVVCLMAAVTGAVHPFLVRALLVLTIMAPMPLIGSCIAAASSPGGSVIQGKGIVLLELLVLVILAALAGSGWDRPAITAVAALLVLLSVFLEKAHLIRRYQHNPPIPLPYSLFEEAPEYRPTFVEWALTAGSAGFCVLLSSAVIYVLQWVR